MKRAVTLLAALAFTAGCAGAAPAGSPAGAVPVGSTADRLDALHQRITGTPADRSAAAVLQYLAYQLPIRECMATNGFSYTPPPFDDPYKSWPAARPMSYIDVLVPVSDEQVGRGLYLAEDFRAPATEPPNPGFTSLDTEGQRRYLAQASACSPPPGSYENEFPTGALQLAYDLEAALGKALGSSPQLRDMAGKYPACMTASGYPVKDRKELAELVRGRHFAAVGSDDQLQAGRAAEQTAARADATCRKDSYPLALTLASPVIAEFEAAHAGTLAELDASWASIREQAREAKAKVTW